MDDPIPKKTEASQIRTRLRLDNLLSGDESKNIFATEKYFSQSTNADVFDIRDGVGYLSAGLQDDGFAALINDDSIRETRKPRKRFIFLDGIQHDPNRLPITSDRLKLIFSTYNITPRFAGFLARQHVPGRTVYYEKDTQKPLQHDVWYSAVIRSSYSHGNVAPDLSREVLDWTAFCLWSTYDLVTADETILVWRYPIALKHKFYSTFQKYAGEELQTHPMLAHAYFTEQILSHTYTFLEHFSEPLYSWEFKAKSMHSAEDFANRSQAFLALSRQMQQAATDCSILMDMVEHLQKANEWFEQHHIPIVSKQHLPSPVENEWSLPRLLKDNFIRYQKDVQLICTYNALYVERTKIGVSECFAMANQRDTEINLKMAAESTQMARISYQDNKSLQVIQTMSMLFLPSSLVSGIFGMAFFNTSPAADGRQALFSVSGNWWLFFAVAVPLTVGIVLAMGGRMTFWVRRRQGERDLEKYEGGKRE
ncbi:MAG: hypothetical protein MMC33_005909 [Icmadophila ericetorum]|nr:hypothetical protein [Icmadophila ericetorum]